mgnify:FL=1
MALTLIPFLPRSEMSDTPKVRYPPSFSLSPR